RGPPRRPANPLHPPEIRTTSASARPVALRRNEGGARRRGRFTRGRKSRSARRRTAGPNATAHLPRRQARQNTSKRRNAAAVRCSAWLGRLSFLVRFPCKNSPWISPECRENCGGTQG